jgi:glycosyltransferase involved in cell wall biosynthesis
MTEDKRVSVVFVTHNEGKFISQSISIAKKVKNFQEVVIVDGGSTDDTVQKAKRLGARVIYQSSTKYPAKGIAMYDGVNLATGDVVVFMDADIMNLNSKMIDQLTDSILVDEADFVKGTFSRSGGRVTELVAKPLLRVFYPEYAHFSQPLSGEIAGRREVLRKIRFEEDWGVDIGLLLDILNLGYRVKEVNIGYKRHDMKPLDELRTMSRQVAVAILRRAAKNGRLLGGIERG